MCTLKSKGQAKGVPVVTNYGEGGYKTGGGGKGSFTPTEMGGGDRKKL